MKSSQMWRYGQPLWAGRLFDDKTAYMERMIWDVLIEISTGLSNIAPITLDPQDTSSGPSLGKPKISTARLQQVVLSAMEEIKKIPGIETAGSTTQTAVSSKKKVKKATHEIEALRGENESLKGEFPDQLSLRSIKLINDSATPTCPPTNEGPET